MTDCCQTTVERLAPSIASYGLGMLASAHGRRGGGVAAIALVVERCARVEIGGGDEVRGGGVSFNSCG